MKILKSLLVIIGMMAIVAGVTTATWTDQKVLGSNTFTTGTLTIDTNPASALFAAQNIYPGWSQTASLIVTNSGTVPLTYQFSTTKSGSSTTLFDSTDFLLKIGTTSGGDELYTGTVKNGSFTASRSLTVDGSETLYFTVSLASSAGDSLQGKSATVNFVFTASS